MAMMLDVSSCKEMLLFVASSVKEHTEMLDEADSLGDSDHGSVMNIGFTAVESILKKESLGDVGSLFAACGRAILMNSGGAGGAVFGSFFKGGAKAFEGKTVLDSSSFALFLQYGLESVLKRGKAAVGDKTMLDALKPAADYAAAHKDDLLDTLVQGCSIGAKNGSESTKLMVAAYGRMKHLGKRTLGHADPGSITMVLILDSMAQFIRLLSVETYGDTQFN